MEHKCIMWDNTINKESDKNDVNVVFKMKEKKKWKCGIMWLLENIHLGRNNTYRTLFESELIP